MRSEKWTIKSPLSGEILSEFIVEANPLPVADAAPVQPARPATNNNAGEKMTEPQRRYLFRLLAAQKVAGKAAEDHLKTYFKVTSLAAITRQAASEYIDQLVKDKQDATT
jgi:hypothetical protein